MKHLSTDQEKSTERPKVVASEIGKTCQCQTGLGLSHGKRTKIRMEEKGSRVNAQGTTRTNECPHVPSKFVHEMRMEESRTAY